MKYKNVYSKVHRNQFELINSSNYKKNFFGEEKEINSYGFRSEEFKNAHRGKHILFSGCSVTSGVGLLQEEMWAKKTYNKILEKEKCSGYFNIGIGASGLCDQVSNMFKYFNIYGNPDIIFFMIPDGGRFYHYEESSDQISHSFIEDEYKNFIFFLYTQYYLMLESYCKSNNIKLFSFSYVSKTQKYFEKKFKTFYSIDFKDMTDFVFNYAENNRGTNYLTKARDDMHYGVAYHEYWANFIYNTYCERSSL
jgi:hypothetical protein